jgi:RNA polymerase-binding transcription factor DksA
MPAKKKSAKKSVAKKSVAKKSATKKSVAKKSVAKTTTTGKAGAKKSAVKKASAKKSIAKKTSSKKKAPVKKSPIEKKPAARVKKRATGSKKRAEKSAAAAGKETGQQSKGLSKADVARSGAGSDKKATPIVFSLDDVAKLMASKKAKGIEKEKPRKPVEKIGSTPEKTAKTIIDDKPTEKRSHAAASLADILGFNPAEKKKRTELDDSEIPKKLKKYYKLLIELRRHVSDEINLHTSDTLKHSARDESGDSAGYGNHQADAGTDSFDRDFALSLVSSEQEALHEIEEAILRIKDGSYGFCAVTGKPIPAARLAAVPFARYSVEGQLEHERNQQRKSNRTVSGGIFGDVGDAPKLQSDDDDDE